MILDLFVPVNIFDSSRKSLLEDNPELAEELENRIKAKIKGEDVEKPVPVAETEV